MTFVFWTILIGGNSTKSKTAARGYKVSSIELATPNVDVAIGSIELNIHTFISIQFITSIGAFDITSSYYRHNISSHFI